jgi:hypothetical protein
MLLYYYFLLSCLRINDTRPFRLPATYQLPAIQNALSFAFLHESIAGFY